MQRLIARNAGAILASGGQQLVRLILMLAIGCSSVAWGGSGMQIFVRMPNQAIITLDVESSDSIENMKTKVQDKTGLPPNRQIPYHGGRRLRDGMTLADYNIQKEAIVVVHLDTDGDGSSDLDENGEANGGDMNSDGTSDSLQNGVATLALPGTTDTVTLVCAPDVMLGGAELTTSGLTAPEGTTFPLGMLSFRIDGVPFAGATDVAIQWNSAHPLVQPSYWKRNASSNNWEVFAYDGTTGLLPSGATPTSVIVRLKDGARGDSDGTENGIIYDPAALGQTDVPVSLSAFTAE